MDEYECRKRDVIFRCNGGLCVQLLRTRGLGLDTSSFLSDFYFSLSFLFIKDVGVSFKRIVGVNLAPMRFWREFKGARYSRFDKFLTLRYI